MTAQTPAVLWDTDVGKKPFCSQSWGASGSPSVTELCAQHWALPQPPEDPLHPTVCTSGPRRTGRLLPEMPLLE